MRGEIFFEIFWIDLIVNVMGGELFYGCNGVATYGTKGNGANGQNGVMGGVGLLTAIIAAHRTKRGAGASGTVDFVLP